MTASEDRLKNRCRSDYVFQLVYRTRWSDNDMYQHMNNSVYYTLFDSIINAYLQQQCGRDPTGSRQIGLVVSSHCDFFKPVGFPNSLELGLRVNQLGLSSVAYEVGVFEQLHEQVCAVGGYTHVFVDRETNRPAAEGMETQIHSGLKRLMLPDKPRVTKIC